MRFELLADAFEKLEATSRRTEMIQTLAGLFKLTPPEIIARVIYLLQGQIAPPFEATPFGMGDQLLIRAIASATKQTNDDVRRLWKKQGDLGDVVSQIKTGPSPQVTVEEAFAALSEIAHTSGPGSTKHKTALLANLLSKLSPPEAKYAVRIVQGRLRLGVGDPTILDSLSFSCLGSRRLRPTLDHAYNVSSDLGLIAETLFSKGPESLDHFQPLPGIPVRPALAERLPSPEAIIERLGPCVSEPKYDGIRLQLHKKGDEIRIFSRRIEDLTHMFPDIAEAATTQISEEGLIAEGEALAFDPETAAFFPFQVTVQRKRKNKIDEMSAKYPLRLFLFDLMYSGGHGILDLPMAERRRKLEDAVKATDTSIITFTEQKNTGTAGEIETYFAEMIERGLEGIVAKRPDAPYQAGKRNYDWVKLKRGYQAELKDTVDCVIIGYLLGRGNRARFGIGSLLVASYDEEDDRFRSVAKIGSGLSDKQWMEMKKLLDQISVGHRPARVDSQLVPDVWVEPKFVVEVQADEITRSPMHVTGKYDSQPGYALRFPRVIDWIREDKKPEDATTEKEILEMFNMQRRTTGR